MLYRFAAPNVQSSTLVAAKLICKISSFSWFFTEWKFFHVVTSTLLLMMMMMIDDIITTNIIEFLATIYLLTFFDIM